MTLLLPAREVLQGSYLLNQLVTLREEVADQLGDVPVPDTQVYVVRSDRDFNTLTQNRIPHWGIGVAYPQAKTIILRYRPGQTEALLRTARHEFSHILLHHAIHETGNRVPVWFNEGLAMWVAREWRLQQSFGVAVAAIRGELIPLGEVNYVLGFGANRAHLAYDQSYLAVQFVVSLGGEGALERLGGDLRDGTPFDVALFRVTGRSADRFEADFAGFVSQRFGLRALVTSEAALWLYIVLLVLIVWAGIRRKNRRTLKRWEEEDPLEGLPLRLQAKIRRERDL